MPLDRSPTPCNAPAPTTLRFAHIAFAPSGVKIAVVDLRRLDLEVLEPGDGVRLGAEELPDLHLGDDGAVVDGAELREHDLPRRLSRGEGEDDLARKPRLLGVQPERRPGIGGAGGLRRQVEDAADTLADRLGAGAQRGVEVLGEPQARHVRERGAAHEPLVLRDRNGMLGARHDEPHLLADRQGLAPVVLASAEDDERAVAALHVDVEVGRAENLPVLDLGRARPELRFAEGAAGGVDGFQPPLDFVRSLGDCEARETRREPEDRDPPGASLSKHA